MKKIFNRCLGFFLLILTLNVSAQAELIDRIIAIVDESIGSCSAEQQIGPLVGRLWQLSECHLSRDPGDLFEGSGDNARAVWLFDSRDQRRSLSEHVDDFGQGDELPRLSA